MKYRASRIHKPSAPKNKQLNADGMDGQGLMPPQFKLSGQGVVQKKDKSLQSDLFKDDNKLNACLNGKGLIQTGASGEHVRKIQIALLQCGHALPKFGADGQFGSETKAAVEAFQAASGFSKDQIDGVVGTLTIDALDKAIGSKNNTYEVKNEKKDGAYGWTSSYQVILTDKEVKILVKTKITPDNDVNFFSKIFTQMQTKRAFSNIFDSKFYFVDDKKVRTLRVGIEYVDSGEHLNVNLHQGDGRDDLSNWYTDSEPIVRAHEMGHQIGLLDEYVDDSGNAPDRATDTSKGVHKDNSIMGNFYNEGLDKAEVKERHGLTIANDIEQSTGLKFKVYKI